MGFFGDLVNGLIGGFNEVAQCTKFMASLTNVGAYAGMDAAGQSTYILNALDSCGAADTPDTFLGEIYPIVVKMVNEDGANISQPKAHESCPAECAYDRSTCDKCLKERLEILEALNYAERPEEYLRIFNSAEGSSAGFVPNTTMSPEQQAYELIYNHQMKDLDFMYSPERKKVMINMICAGSLVGAPTIPKAMRLKLAEEQVNEELQLKKAKMSLSDLYFAADHYHMNVPAYLRELFNGSSGVKTAAMIRKEEQDKIESELRKQELERDREYYEQKRERERQQSLERLKRTNNMIYSSGPPQYVGAGTSVSRTCADCTYYSPGARKCAYKNQSTNAGDSCGFFSRK